MGWAMFTSGYQVGKVTINNALVTTENGNYSDIRLKQEIAPIASALSKIDSLTGVYYHWRSQEYPDKGFSSDRQIGLIAQQVEKVLPEVVHTSTEDGFKSTSYGKMVSVLVAAVKEPKAQNEELQRRVTELEQQ